MADIKTMYTDGSYLETNQDWHQKDSPYKAKLVAKTIERSGLTFSTCADIGCGAGLVSELLAERYPASRFTGFELSADVRGFWRERKALSNLTFRQEDMFEQAETFDLVLCLDVFEHVEDYFGFLRRLRRTGKAFIFKIPLDMNAVKIMTGGIAIAREEAGHLHYFTPYTALKAIEDTGYTVRTSFVDASFTGAGPRNLRQAALLPFRLLSLALGPTFAATTFGGATFMVAATA